MCFALKKREFIILETRKFAQARVHCQYATQSGPSLVINGKIHPKFIKGGPSKFILSGVGVSTDGLETIFLISNEPVNFHHFASVFLDHLAINNALYLDCLLYTSPSPRDGLLSRMPSSA